MSIVGNNNLISTEIKKSYMRMYFACPCSFFYTLDIEKWI